MKSTRKSMEFMSHTHNPNHPVKSSPDLALIPKVELHLHFEGSMSPELIRRLAEKYNLTLDLEFSEDGKQILWNDFLHFLFKYDEASRVACTKEAVEEIAYDYLRISHAHGSIYNELTVSPDHLARFGLSYVDAVGAVEAGIRKAKAEFGIDANIIIVILRHGDKPDFGDLEASRRRSQEQSIRLMKTMLDHSFDHVVGVGLAGAEREFPPELFTEAFQMAAQAGLGLTAHAGEWTNADDVMKAVNLLGVTRVGHGIHAAFDKDKLREAKERCVHFELCPHSNLSLNTKQHYPDTDKDGPHPVSIFHEHDMSFSLSSDDPPFFGTNLLKEYQYVVDTLKLDTEKLLKITLNGIQASFASAELKQELVAKVRRFAEKHAVSIEFDAPVNLSRNAIK